MFFINISTSYQFSGFLFFYMGRGKSPSHDIVLNKPGISQRKKRFTDSIKGAV